MLSRLLATLILGAALVIFASPVITTDVAAQDLKYTTTTSIELPGRVGTALRWAQRIAGGSSETVETVYLKDRRMRTDDGSSSVIMDLADGRMVFLDHDRKSYSVLTFADAAEMTEEMMVDAQAALDEARRDAEDAREEAGRSLEEEGVEVRYDVRVDRTGETKTIRGHRAERIFLIMAAEGSRVAQTEEEEDFEGSLVLATEMWMTNDASGELAALFSFYEQSAEAMSEHMQTFASSSQAFSEGLAGAFASDPQMREMTERAAEEMAQMDGVSLVSTMKMVLVPGGMTFDSRMAFDGETEREEVSTTQRAGRLARGLVRSRLGRGGNNDADEEEEKAPAQRTMMTIKTEITDVQRAALDAALFEIPQDYAETTLF